MGVDRGAGSRPGQAAARGTSSWMWPEALRTAAARAPGLGRAPTRSTAISAPVAGRRATLRPAAWRVPYVAGNNSAHPTVRTDGAWATRSQRRAAGRPGLVPADLTGAGERLAVRAAVLLYELAWPTSSRWVRPRRACPRSTLPQAAVVRCAWSGHASGFGPPSLPGSVSACVDRHAEPGLPRKAARWQSSAVTGAGEPGSRLAGWAATRGG